MKIVKPMKVAVLTRAIERARRPEFHVAAMLGFPLATPRALLDELAFWAGVSAALGASGVVDEGLAKGRGELLVAGSFHAPGGAPLPASYVRVKLGAVDKRLSVIGDRFWRDGVPTEPEPVLTIPIDWTHAFGGPGFERNPYGKGARPIEEARRTVHPLPNVEPYGALLRSPSERPEPSGLRAMDLTFAQRRGRAGTYDDRWLDEHYPGMPPDAAPTFFNAAPEDQWIEGFFRGDEDFLVENMHPEAPRIEGRLPGLVTRCFVTHRKPDGEGLIEIPLHCDTVWLFPSLGLGAVIFHGSHPIAEDDAADIVHLVCACEDPASPQTAEHYQAALARRLDKDKSTIAELSDSDLMPPRASGVAPNIGELDVGRWVKSENIAAANMRRGQERRLGEMRAVIEAEGLDPAEYGAVELPAEPEAPPVDDPDALAAYMEAQLSRTEAALGDLDAKAAEAREQAREALAEMGEGYDDMMEQASKDGPGPPKFTAAAHLAMLREMADDARSDGMPLEDLEQQIADPKFRAELERQEQGLREMYRQAGHLQPTAAAISRDASDRARVLVELAIETGESLAGRDFTGANLSGMRLVGLDLSGAFLEAADLSGADLSRANLESAVLAKANLERVDLRDARLRGANLGGAKLHDAVLERADLTDSILSKADVAGARFTGAQLTGVDWLGAVLGAVDLSGAALGRSHLLNADLRGARFAAADLSEATLVDCQLDGADFSRATLAKTSFVRCAGRNVSFREVRFRHGVMAHGSSFPGADFRDADMEQANVRGTVLTGAHFDRANLDGADLSECDAGGASFERAVVKDGLLIRTNLGGASLRGANMMDALASKARVPGADFTGANLYRADFSRVVGDAQTTFADAEVGHVRVQPAAAIGVRGAP